MKRLLFFLLILLTPNSRLRADEGMWIPALLDQNFADMQARGLKLSADDIYSVNHSSLKDAVCQFGGGCTAELISSKGLLLTNHHCGFSYIQYFSTVQNDYLTNGFWAMKQDEELPCPGLTVTFIVSMENVTAKVLAGVYDTTSETRRIALVSANAKAIEKENTKDGLDAFVRAFYYGNEYYMFITQTFTDVRMVGAPAYQIGDFGGDADNWVWPRQTGDFSLFRIYVDKDNKPAKYSKDNVPYTPKKFFKINANGVGENDFTMVYGFPGKTTEYLTSYGVNLIENVSDPLKVDLRTQRINIMEQSMLSNDTIRIKYAAKRNGAANAWKKWQGEMLGLKNADAIAEKKKKEDEFMTRVNANPLYKTKYGDLLPKMDSLHKDIYQWQRSLDFFSEGCFQVELIRFAYSFGTLAMESAKDTPDVKVITKQRNDLYNAFFSFYKDYDLNVDKVTAAAMFASVWKGIDTSLTSFNTVTNPKGKKVTVRNSFPFMFREANKKYKGDWKKYFDQLFSRSMFIDSAKVRSLILNWKNSDWKKIKNDPLFQRVENLYSYYYAVILPGWTSRNNEITRLQRLYMAGLMEVCPEKKYYPDANSTLRVAFGKIDEYSPKDGVVYKWYSTLDGVFQKEDSTSLDYAVPARLKQLWLAKDYGPYADKDGTLHTSFIASNHTTGGNSGSPVLDKNGDLIGTNFDRCWEGTMSDVNYDPTVCRNITLDVRYTLFIIDKYAGAGYLLKEMEFAKPN
ncbi:MAG TPA: S46 family peptidase [Bacteroidia bacterium]|jgi:hypothetical protein|nr:S46 family peptidase [Bacteroidia bacterium]